ncbi:hypothetical protein [Streptomyces fructofermentans]|uniref:hypothetical protein n=1 Tax=Streptomyces fructofermentans TaxID=152141 RepID=UPI0037879573
MDDEEALRRYGLHPAAADLDEIRELLRRETASERRAQGDGDTELMKLFCVQLFNCGDLEDALLVWDAKSAGFDAACSIDIQLLLGRGLEAVKAHLSTRPAPSAAAALHRLRELERDGEFEDFSVREHSAFYDSYYGDR